MTIFSNHFAEDIAMTARSTTKVKNMCVYKDLWEHQSTAIVSKNSTIKGTVKMYDITYVTDIQLLAKRLSYKN
jgi:hypothetical protein